MTPAHTASAKPAPREHRDGVPDPHPDREEPTGGIATPAATVGDDR
jgi:hypothetical protein